MTRRSVRAVIYLGVVLGKQSGMLIHGLSQPTGGTICDAELTKLFSF
jgi:hypothetical protein